MASSIHVYYRTRGARAGEITEAVRSDTPRASRPNEGRLAEAWATGLPLPAPTSHRVRLTGGPPALVARVLRLHVYYVASGDTAGRVVAAILGDQGVPPRPLEDREARFETAPDLTTAPPTAATHRVAVGPPPALVPQDPPPPVVPPAPVDNTAQRRSELERSIAARDLMRTALLTRGYSTTEIDQEIAAKVAEHAALP
jgi:hypothetical protein